MVTNFDAITQYLVFRSEYLTEQPALPITVIKNGIHYMELNWS